MVANAYYISNMTSSVQFKCCLPKCKSTNLDSNLIKFPTNDKLQELWLKYLVPHCPDLENLTKKALRLKRVCIKHFEKQESTPDGGLIVLEYPTLFTKNEIIHGIPLNTDLKEKGDHTYSKPVVEAQIKNISGNKLFCDFKTKTTNEATKLFCNSSTKLPQKQEAEIVLLDHEELDDLIVGPMVPLAPIINESYKSVHKLYVAPKYSPRTRNLGPFSCHDCGRTFPYKNSLRTHIISVHSKLKLFKCDICNRGFAIVGTLIKHKQTHSDDRPFYCEFCGKSFKYKWYHKEHMFTHTNKQRLMCEICSGTFATHAALWMHMRDHHPVGNKTYSCCYCNKKFTNFSEFQQHKETHKGKQFFKCSICAMSYSSKAYLQIHLLKHVL